MISLTHWGLEKMQRFLNTNERQARHLRGLRASQGVFAQSVNLRGETIIGHNRPRY